MSDTNSNTKLHWLIFLASTVALIAAVALKWPYLTMIIPFVCTFFVKAMRII